MQSDFPIPIESRALGTLTYIRRSIDASASMAVPGMAGVVMGVIGLLATGLASLPHWGAHWPRIWMCAAGVASLVGGALMAREAAQSGHARYLGPVRKFMLCLCPALFAGGVLTVVLWPRAPRRTAPRDLAAALRLRRAVGKHRDHREHHAALLRHGRAVRRPRLFAFVLPAASHMAMLGFGIRRAARGLRLPGG